MIAGDAPPFGVLLKRHRTAAGLTQEELAELAHLSAYAVSALERGVNQWPHGDTVALLTEALALTKDQQAVFAGAARPPTRRLQTPPGAPPPPAHRGNLALALTSFIGREREQATVRQLLRKTRLLTLTGPGGCGKTRLALQVAGALREEYPDGVWLVELASLISPELVPQAVTAALGIAEEAGRSITSALTDFLASRRLLLVLDNCEHLVSACAVLASNVLRGCPHVRVLATSREGLEVAGETLYLVPSLEGPDPRQMLSTEDMLDFPAVRLFVERACARRVDFALTARNAGAVTQVCRRLDGIPLAIELAAARIDTLPMEAIASRLDDCFRLLTGGPRMALPHQKTLLATLDWSYELLSTQEQLLLTRLSVFAGGWTLEAAEAVCAAPPNPFPSPASIGENEVGAWDLLDCHSGLVHKSLVEMEKWDGSTRYRLLETVRQYGREKSAGELTTMREQHLAWYLALAERAAPLLRGAEQAVWLARLEREHDNLRAALHWARESGRLVPAMRLAGALGRFWWMSGRLSEGRGWLEGLPAQAGSAEVVSAAVRARVVTWAGVLAGSQGDYEQAAALHRASLALYQAMGDTGGSAESLHNLGVVAQHQGEYGRATSFIEESLALRRDLDDHAGMAESLSLLGLIAAWQGDNRRAEAALVEGLALYQDLKDRWGVAGALGSLGWPAKSQGNYGQAEALSAESLALYRELGDKQGAAVMLCNLGRIVREQGDAARSEVLAAESLALARELGSKRDIATALIGLAWAANYHGEYDRAEALSAESLALYRCLGSRWGMAFALHALGAVAYSRGNQAQAAGFYKESLTLYWAAGEKPTIAGCLENLAKVACAQGQGQRATRLLGAASALRETIGVPMPPVNCPGYDCTVEDLRTMLGDDMFQAVRAEGRVLPLEQAIAEALEIPGAD